MKTLSFDHIDMIQAAQKRSRQHNYYMATIETIRGQRLDNVLICCPTRESSFKAWRFFTNQLKDYKVTREVIETGLNPIYGVRLNHV